MGVPAFAEGPNKEEKKELGEEVAHKIKDNEETIRALRESLSTKGRYEERISRLKAKLEKTDAKLKEVDIALVNRDINRLEQIVNLRVRLLEAENEVHKMDPETRTYKKVAEICASEFPTPWMERTRDAAKKREEFVRAPKYAGEATGITDLDAYNEARNDLIYLIGHSRQELLQYHRRCQELMVPALKETTERALRALGQVPGEKPETGPEAECKEKVEKFKQYGYTMKLCLSRYENGKLKEGPKQGIGRVEMPSKREAIKETDKTPKTPPASEPPAAKPEKKPEGEGSTPPADGPKRGTARPAIRAN